MRLAAGFGDALERLRVELDTLKFSATGAGGVQASALVQGRRMVVAEAG